MIFRAVVQYEGTRYRGWQVQGNTQQTIQGKLESVLGRMEGEPVEVHGSGRTDAGVHASGQVIHFHCNRVKDSEVILEYLNQYLPEDIGVVLVEEAPSRFHARLQAVRKTYAYTIWNSPLPNALERRFVTQVKEPLKVEEMRRAAAFLCGTHDFVAFSSLNPRRFRKSTVRTLEKLQILQEGQKLRLLYTGDGFLYHMVRILTGTLVEVGLGLRKAEEMEEILESRDREKAGRTMPPEGLMLCGVQYPDRNFQYL